MPGEVTLMVVVWDREAPGGRSISQVEEHAVMAALTCAPMSDPLNDAALSTPLTLVAVRAPLAASVPLTATGSLRVIKVPESDI
jgi:hypothetical protein